VSRSASPPSLVLASASPRRLELLRRVGLTVEVSPSDIDETPLSEETPGDYVRRVAREKCEAALRRKQSQVPAPEDSDLSNTPPTAILAADTTVILEGEIFGKPQSKAHAAEMLSRLAGRRHEVTTAYAIAYGEKFVERAVSTAVSVRLIEPAEIEAYVASGEWRGKAGGYAIQGRAALFVTDIRGSLTAVIGLPLAEVVADLRALGALDTYPPKAFGGDLSKTSL